MSGVRVGGVVVIERKSIGLVEVFVDDVGCCVRRRGPSERRLRCGWAVRPVPALARGPKMKPAHASTRDGISAARAAATAAVAP